MLKTTVPGFNTLGANRQTQFGRRAKPAEVEQIRDFLRNQGLGDDVHKLDPKLTFIQDWRGIKEETLWGKLKLFLYKRESDRTLKAIAQNKSFKDPQPWGAVQAIWGHEHVADALVIEGNEEFQQLVEEANAKGLYSPIHLVYFKQPPDQTITLQCRRGTFPPSFLPPTPAQQP
jgi:hypothetical protein